MKGEGRPVYGEEVAASILSGANESPSTTHKPGFGEGREPWTKGETLHAAAVLGIPHPALIPPISEFPDITDIRKVYSLPEEGLTQPEGHPDIIKRLDWPI